MPKMMRDLYRTVRASNITVRSASTGLILRMETPTGKPIQKQRSKEVRKAYPKTKEQRGKDQSTTDG